MPGRTDIDPQSITDGKISNQAKISHSKIAPAVEGQILVAQSNGKFSARSLSGDVTIKADGSATSTASVVVSGEATVIQGPAGPAGPAGPIGPQGNQGESGPAGGDATVTTSAVDTAGAVMHTDFGSDGFIKRNGLGTYTIDSNSYCQGDDSRLADTRDPNSHKSTHATGGTDALSPSDIGASADDHTHSAYVNVQSDWDASSGDAKILNKPTVQYESAIADATGIAAGLMPSADKTKLDGVDTGAEVNVLSDWDATTGDAVISNKPNVQYTSAISDATTSAGGLMSSTDKTKLDGVASSAEVNVSPDWDASTGDAAISNKPTLGDSASKDVGPASDEVAAGDHTHDDLYFQESEFLNASAGAGSAGKPVKLDAEGHIDTTMINDGDISFADLDDIPTTFAPSAHTHAHSDLTDISNLQHIDWTATSPTPIHASNYTDTTANETITLSGDVSGSGTTAITCTVDDDSHSHAIDTITGVLDASAGAGSAGKLIKLDAAGHIDSTMINDGDISFVDLDDIPSTFAPSAHNHAGGDITSGTIDTDRLDVGASAGKVAAGDHAHSQYSTFDIDDSSALTTDVWSASKIISYLATFYATLANGFAGHKYTAAIEWESPLALQISSTGWAQGSGSGAWQANQSYASLAQTSTTGSGAGALFNVAVDTSGVPTFTWVSGGGGYAVDDTLTFTDPGSTSETCVVTVTAIVTPTGISFSGTTGSMVCTINHGLSTEYITMSVRDKDDVIEDLGHTSIVTVIDANNVKLEYSGTDYPDVGEDKFITIIG